MSVAIKTYRNVFGSIDNEGNLLPNNNVLYGPYESIDKAYDTIYNALGNDIPIGLTIGIKVDDKITEYWFNEGITKYNLVAKNKTSSNGNIDIEDIKTDINTNKNNITLLDKNVEALSLSTQKIIDGRIVVAEAGKAGKAERDSDGKIIKDTYAKQEDYNYTLGTALATSELGKYLNISHNYNKTLAIPYATENNGGVISAEDKNIINANTTDLNNIKKGTLVVSKTYSDQNGNNIYNTYATKSSVNNISSDILALQSKIVPVTLEADGLMPKSMLGTNVATKELGNYVEIKHNYNESYLLIPKATSEISGAMSPEDKSKLNNININSPIAYAVYADTSTDVEVTTISGYFPTELVAGARITINIRGNISLIKTLNVNGTGAKNVYYTGSSLTGGMIDRYNVYDFIYDGTYYRIIGINTDTNTHYTAKLVAGASDASKTNENAENGNVHINLIEDNKVRSYHNIVGEGDVSVRSDATGRIIIESRVEETLGLDVTNLFREGSSILGNTSDLITKKLYTKNDSGNLTYPVTFYPHGDTEDNISSSVGYLYREHIIQVSGQISTKKYIATIRQNGPYIVCDAVDSRTSTL